ncbi:hypothetical protein JZ751_018031 [Albula glossodonta]|uniref:Uncharacterized protein n=1 Tax=Albula glossodonta TaxID=121402 RepID=A0A8T2PPZ7_9TELE|nr:hypothetical protein JZ751_018031 [Albula glossodonta]
MSTFPLEAEHFRATAQDVGITRRATQHSPEDEATRGKKAAKRQMRACDGLSSGIPVIETLSMGFSVDIVDELKCGKGGGVLLTV